MAYAREVDTTKLEFTPKTLVTIVDIKSMRKEFVQIRGKGVAYDREEEFVGLSCIAAPIRDFTGEVIAALSISTPTIRFTQ